ncbi:MAG: LysM peptidoglycan-binding domain-containing protein [Bdellovibrionaceae bacterium]|nr:LysM peptidoglycan-binding domain-containing protein [Bdellovibrionales bacterium]MCB9084390.1 LysM peptidoglycan-binding domain-containing protein [Pseudobdellovibrionaceae bacterium]
MIQLRIVLASMIVLGLTACGHLRTAPDGSRVSTLEGDEDQEKIQQIEGANDELSASPAEQNNIPIEVNKQVQKWVDYFQGRGRKHMQRYLERSSRYLPMMKRELQDAGLPTDLVYVALIESGFNSSANSRAAAVGYWQFIRGTGKVYGLQIDAFVDERRDPVLSTRAAARYFKALHNLFGNWYLALASYNTGENRVKRAVMKYYTRDFWKLAKRRRLHRETINYVPKFIAATLIAKNPEVYGFRDVDYQPELAYDEIQIDKPISLQKLSSGMSGVSYEEMRKLNPMYRTYFIPVPQGKKVTLRVPVGMKDRAFAAVDMSYSAPPKYVATEFRYRVRRGDTLSGIAKRHRTSVGTLRRMNRLGRRSFIRVGQRLRVPERQNMEHLKYEQTNPSVTRRIAAQRRVRHHQVKRGENLSLIARKYRTSVAALRDLNQLNRRSMIRVGQKLVVSDSKGQVHVVRRGDTLSGIARRYSTSITQLAQANQLTNRSHIMIGSELIIPQ